MRVLLIFKGAHEIASLSWFFYVKIKEQNQIKSLTSNVNMPQYIKIKFCLINSVGSIKDIY